MFKVKNKLHPSLVQERFSFVNNVHNINTRNKKKFYQKGVKTKLKSLCLSVMGVKMFNAVPNDLKQINKLGWFKRSLKKHIIQNY